MSQVDSRLELFAGMLMSCHNLYLWQYDSGFHLIRSNCPMEGAINNLFGLLRGGRLMGKQLLEQDTPVLLTNNIGLMWATQPLLEDSELARLYVLGPLFLDDISPKSLEAQLDAHGLTSALKSTARRFLQQLPIISLNRVFEYSIMLHYCVTGETISVSDLRYDETGNRAVSAGTTEQVDAHGTYEAEQEMIRLVREGDIKNFRTHMDRLSVTGNMGKLRSIGSRYFRRYLYV